MYLKYRKRGLHSGRLYPRPAVRPGADALLSDVEATDAKV
jgi:hypothetical protein